MEHLRIPANLDRETLRFCADFCQEFARPFSYPYNAKYEPKLVGALQALATAFGQLSDPE